MSLLCNHCGKEIKTREPYFSGMKDEELYNLHPACRADFIKKTGEVQPCQILRATI